VRTITEIIKKTKSNKEIVEKETFNTDLKKLIKRCYQCGRCSGVCQLSKVQKFAPSRIIQLILEGFENKVLESGILWDCLTCNQCLKDCPQNINFADIVRIARYKMRKKLTQNLDEHIAHKAIYTTISEMMCRPYINPNRSLEWIPKECNISDKGNILYYVGCIPFFKFEFEGLDEIAVSSLKIICRIEKEPIVVLKDEICCGHDLYWGQGDIDTFIKLAKRNFNIFKKTGINTIITSCAECYRTFKIDYAEIIKDFEEKFEVKHIIDYIYEKWKAKIIKFVKIEKDEVKKSFTFHDPCRLSRFLPKENRIMEKIREIFDEFKKLGYNFNEMEHNKENSLCCGVSSWMNCNEKSKALRYKRMLEAKAAGSLLITSCPKCNIHLKCLQNDFENIASIVIKDFSEFLVDHIQLINHTKEKM